MTNILLISHIFLSISYTNKLARNEKQVSTTLFWPYFVQKRFLDMATSLKFRHVKGSFQRKLNEDIRKIKSSSNVFVFADKTNNINEMSKDDH